MYFIAKVTDTKSLKLTLAKSRQLKDLTRCVDTHQIFIVADIYNNQSVIKIEMIKN